MLPWGLWFCYLVGVLGTGLFTALAGAAGVAECLWSAQFIGRPLGAATLADTGGFADNVLICVMQCGQPPGRCPFLLGGSGDALITARIPSLVWAMLVGRLVVVGGVSRLSYQLGSIGI